jgi:hypothetical protein
MNEQFSRIKGYDIKNVLINLQQLILEVTDICNPRWKYCGYGDLYQGHNPRGIGISIIILSAVLAGCGGGSKKLSDDFITVDVTAAYPQKELILQDFMDVEYIPLESTDQFINQGVVKAIGKDILLITNRIVDGDIFVFSRAGKGLRKINRLGRSGEEYSQITEIVLDEDNNEMFVIDYPARKIVVYDLYGNFKRSFWFADTSYYICTFNYDPNQLVSFKSYLPSVESGQSSHILISKQDGAINREIKIPLKEIETPALNMNEIDITPSFYLTLPDKGGWVFTRPSSDTVYSYHPDGIISALIVRTPSIHATDPEVFLFPTVLTERYYFMQTMKKEFDLEKMKGFPTIELAYDKQEKTIFRYTVYNDDFTSREQVSLSTKPVNNEIAITQSLEALDLVKAYEKGELKGELGEIAAKLDFESNPVIMLIKHKETK